MTNNTPQEIWDKIKTFKKIAMSLHRGPDGDCLGTTTAMKYVLEKQLNIKVHLVSGDPLSRDISDLKLQDEVDFTKDITDLNLSQYDCLLCLDQGDEGMVSSKVTKGYHIPEGTFVINIDHHQSNPYYGDLNYVIPQASSCCEVLLDILRAGNISFDKELARRLLIGIVTDTYFFHWGTSPKVFKDVGFLLEQGVEYEREIAEPILFNESIGQKKFTALVYGKLKFIEDKHFAYVTLSRKEVEAQGINISESKGASNMIQDLAHCNFIFTLMEEDDGIRGSFRSKRGFDVSKLAGELGGGGHKAAAGFFITGMSLQQAEQKVLETIERVGVTKSA
jgi:bifunctional oligoribonuclease and PAP phosphatase NrnA